MWAEPQVSALADNTIETAEVLSKMAGTTTVVAKKVTKTTGKSGSKTISISESSRPLLTPDECMRLPGTQKKPDGTIESGDMLIFTAGNSPTYGRQILHFIDPVFSARSKMVTPLVSDSFYREIPLPE